MKYIYVSKEEAIKGNSLVYAVSGKKIENYKKINEDTVEYVGENLPHYITYDKEKDIIRETTLYEEYLLGRYILSEGEYTENNQIIFIAVPGDLYIPKWNRENNTWEESASLQESKLIIKNQLMDLNQKSNAHFLANFINLDLKNEIRELEKKHADIDMRICFEEGINEQS